MDLFKNPWPNVSPKCLNINAFFLINAIRHISAKTGNALKNHLLRRCHTIFTTRISGLYLAIYGSLLHCTEVCPLRKPCRSNWCKDQCVHVRFLYLTEGTKQQRKNDPLLTEVFTSPLETSSLLTYQQRKSPWWFSREYSLLKIFSGIFC